MMVVMVLREWWWQHAAKHHDCLTGSRRVQSTPAQDLTRTHAKHIPPSEPFAERPPARLHHLTKPVSSVIVFAGETTAAQRTIQSLSLLVAREERGGEALRSLSGVGHGVSSAGRPSQLGGSNVAELAWPVH